MRFLCKSDAYNLLKIPTDVLPAPLMDTQNLKHRFWGLVESLFAPNEPKVPLNIIVTYKNIVVFIRNLQNNTAITKQT